MSVLHSSKIGWYISHKDFIKHIYHNVGVSSHSFSFKPELFKIVQAYRQSNSRKRKENNKKEDKDVAVWCEFERDVMHVQELYNSFFNEIKELVVKKSSDTNADALSAATVAYTESGRIQTDNLLGSNCVPALIKDINGGRFLFPEKCKFYSKDVSDLSQVLQEKFDLILLDPPWWNKYIRRKRKRTDHAYGMMYNDDLKLMPLENCLKDDGLIVVWCTNSHQHLKILKDEIFPKWGVQYIGKWYWVKVTQAGETVCPFSSPPRKQPFEQIIFGSRESRSLLNPPSGKLVVSVPSAVHSHKPPLIKLLEPFLPSNPGCLEIFARYLLPNWTSYGNEVLRLQHESLYTRVDSL